MRGRRDARVRRDGPARRDERGLSESVQLALIWPTLLLATLGVIQAGIWVHGHNVAVRAAAAAADTARGTEGDVAAARELATDIARAGGLDGVDVRVDRSPTRVEVVVSGDAPVMLDLGLGRVSESAAAPVERETAP